MIQPGVARKDLSCGGCLASFYLSKELPLIMFRRKLAVRCPICDYISLIRINANSEVEILSDDPDYNDYFQDENGDTFKKDQNGSFIPTPLP